MSVGMSISVLAYLFMKRTAGISLLHGSATYDVMQLCGGMGKMHNSLIKQLMNSQCIFLSSSKVFGVGMLNKSLTSLLLLCCLEENNRAVKASAFSDERFGVMVTDT